LPIYLFDVKIRFCNEKIHLMKDTKVGYHHGNLRAVLLAAGEQALAATGVAGFSLREVARLSGVSHAAPAHHFKNANGLLTALAIDGFRRFLAAMRRRQESADEDPAARILASGLGYVDFARANPALFRLMFGDERIAHDDPELTAAADAAFLHLAEDVGKFMGASPFAHPPAMARTLAIWNLVHGYVQLMNAGYMKVVQNLPEVGRDAYLVEVLGLLLRPPAARASKGLAKIPVVGRPGR
jgi:AcrR family transcriptional regulator